MVGELRATIVITFSLCLVGGVHGETGERGRALGGRVVKKVVVHLFIIYSNNKCGRYCGEKAHPSFLLLMSADRPYKLLLSEQPCL